MEILILMDLTLLMGGRYETCWVDIVRANYKDDFVVNAGLNGRLAEPRQFLYDVTLRQYAPIGLLVIMLGTKCETKINQNV